MVSFVIYGYTLMILLNSGCAGVCEGRQFFLDM